MEEKSKKIKSIYEFTKQFEKRKSKTSKHTKKLFEDFNFFPSLQIDKEYFKKSISSLLCIAIASYILMMVMELAILKSNDTTIVDFGDFLEYFMGTTNFMSVTFSLVLSTCLEMQLNDSQFQKDMPSITLITIIGGGLYALEFLQIKDSLLTELKEILNLIYFISAIIVVLISLIRNSIIEKGGNVENGNK